MLAATAGRGGVLTADTVDLIVSVIIVLMLVTPYLIANADAMAERFLALISTANDLAPILLHPERRNRPGTGGGAGAGRGQVVQTLVAQRLKPVLIDVNPKSREYAHQHGLHFHLGDAGHEEVLMHAGLAGVCMAVVTVPTPMLRSES